MNDEETVEVAARAMEPKAFARYDIGFTCQNINAQNNFLAAEKVVKSARRKARLALEAVKLLDILREHETMRSTLNIIVGSAADGLQRTQAIGALTNIGPRLSA